MTIPDKKTEPRLAGFATVEIPDPESPTRKKQVVWPIIDDVSFEGKPSKDGKSYEYKYAPSPIDVQFDRPKIHYAEDLGRGRMFCSPEFLQENLDALNKRLAQAGISKKEEEFTIIYLTERIR